MIFHDFEYLKLVEKILKEGEEKSDRTGTGTISLPFQQMRFPLYDGSIPLLTTKKMHVRSIIYELLWYLRGDTNIKYLNDNGVTIWNAWADENGDLGPVYGAQWRSWKTYNDYDVDYNVDPITCKPKWNTIDQIDDVIQKLRTNPTDRRIIVSAWNVGEIDQMRLPPCHLLFQFWSNGSGELRCHLYQRSCDVGLGVPFNIVQYSILTHMIAHVTGHTAVEFVWTGGDVHIYKNHIEQLKQQLQRTPHTPPKLELNPNVTEINDFTYEDINIISYTHHPAIRMDVSV